MVDDHTQRPFRSSETIARSAPAKPLTPSGNDPLAELARLIGQNDPFSEFGRDGTRRVAAPQAQEPAAHAQDLAHDWNAQPAGAGFAPPPIAPDPRWQGPQGGNGYHDEPPAQSQNLAQNFAPSFGRQQFGSAPLAGGDDLYRHDAHQAYDDDGYDPNNPTLANEQADFYDDEPPSRRRMGIMVIAGVFALAVIGTAGAFGYRALFGVPSSSAPPPVIKADATPSKIVPASNQSGKQITDRINDKGIGEKLVSREEQPVPVSPQPQDANQASGPGPLGSGIVGSEPKKIRTIAIRPDQPDSAPQASAPPAPPPQQQPVRVAAPAPATAKPAAPPPRVVATAPPANDDAEPAPPPAPRAAVPRTAPPVQQAAAPAASANAPLSLSPDAAPAAPVRSARPAAAPAPVRTAAVAAPVSAGNGGSYAVQVSSQRSEAEAQAAFRALQGQFPGQLGGKQVLVRQVDLGEKGVYYRAMVPSASGSEASELCTSLKAAGGSCIIQRN
jgi:hypothetical protein